MQYLTPGMMQHELEDAADHWGLLAAVGTLLIIMGFVAMVTPVIATGAAIYLLGFIMVVGGLAAIIGGIRQRKSGGLAFYLLMGVLSLIAGVLIVRNPLESIATITLLIAVWLFVSGIFRIVAGFLQKEGRGWNIFGGIVAMLLGAMLWTHFPTSALWFLGLAVGIEMIFMGWGWLAAGLAAKKVREGAPATSA